MINQSLYKRLCSSKPIFSIEFFPPKSEKAAAQLLKTAAGLQRYQPDFASITYGAGGSTRERTLQYARQLHEQYDYTVMPHLTCVGHSREELKTIINDFKEAGLAQIMALRGDPPKGEKNFKPHPDGLHYASELVELIQEVYPECLIGVAGYPEKHPEADSPEIDLGNLRHKVDQGAHFVTTQLFFDNEKYFNFVDRSRAAGIDQPILPGLMCATSRDQAIRFCEMCGTSVPPELDARLLAAGDDSEAVESAGVEWVFQQACELLDRGVPGIHLYILNRTGPTTRLMDRLQSAGYFNEA